MNIIKFSDLMQHNMSIKQRIYSPFIVLASNIGFFEVYSKAISNLHPRVVVIVYHRVGPCKDPWSLDTISGPLFESQIKYLKTMYKIISFKDYLNSKSDENLIEKRYAIITFDDGYKDIYIHAYPILKRYNVPATLFLTTGHIETNKLFWWDQIGYAIWKTKLKSIKTAQNNSISLKYSYNKLQYISKIVEYVKQMEENDKNDYIEDLINQLDINIPKNIENMTLSWEEIIEMYNNGFDIGAHSVNHPILTKIPTKQAEYEIVQSKIDIEKHIRAKVDGFSYPNGTDQDYNQQIVDILIKNKFKYAVTVIQKVATLNSDNYHIERIMPGWDYSSFKLFTCGLYSDIKSKKYNDK